MKRTLLLLLCGIHCGLPVAAQEYSRTKLSSEYRDDKSAVISAEKEYPGIQTVVIQFSQLENCDNVSPTERIEVHQSGPLLTLRPTNDRQYVRYAYSYRVYDHAVDPKVDREFLYRLPFSAAARQRSAGPFPIPGCCRARTRGANRSNRTATASPSLRAIRSTPPARAGWSRYSCPKIRRSAPNSPTRATSR